MKHQTGQSDIAQLRLLSTTDLHMQLLGHDYVSDKPLNHAGLAGLARLIADARAEAQEDGRGCLLLDNGDALQGNALASWLSRQPVCENHPLVSAFNTLGYDAVGLGNHDLDYGLDYLSAVTSHLRMPVTCSNLAQQDMGPIRQTAILDLRLPCTGPTAQPDHHLRIGILSVLPEQTAIWNRNTLEQRARILPAAPALTQHAKALRDAGADLVVVLAHMGIGKSGPATSPADNALSLARVAGVDAIITGHTHRRFPGTDHADSDGIDPVTGTLDSCPAIMAGHGASDLAVMDLTLQRTRGAWKVIGHDSGLRRNGTDVPPDPRITALCAPAHGRTRRHFASRITTTDRDLHNYFALATPSRTDALIAGGKIATAREQLRGTPDADLPLLACTAAHTAGGLGGPGNYLLVPKGPVRRRHMAGLAPYDDPLWAVRVNGHELRGWLEYAASIYALHGAGWAPDRLTDARTPTFNYDTVFGINYTIDPTRPSGERIRSLRHADQPVRDADRFIMVTNPFRAAGGGGFPIFPPDRICLRGQQPLADVLIETLSRPQVGPPDPTPWRFETSQPVQSVLVTTPKALNFLDDIAHLKPRHIGDTADGFIRLGLTL